MSFGARIRPNNNILPVAKTVGGYKPPGMFSAIRSTFSPVKDLDDKRFQYLTDEEAELFKRSDDYFYTLFESKSISQFERHHGCDFGSLRELQSSMQSYSINACIAGGSVMSAVINESDKACDIDVFPYSWSDFQKFIQVYVDDRGWYHISDTDREFLRNDPSSVKFVQLRPNHDEISRTWGRPDRRPIQLIKMAWNDCARSVIDSFDLRCVMFALEQGKVVYTGGALKDLTARRLTINSTLFPIGLCKRIKKYSERGFSMIDGEVDDMINVLGGSTLVSSEVVGLVTSETIQDTGFANWDNPQYREDYYSLEANEFRRKWEGHSKG